jgi:ketosteroid isomerase-like protein
MSQENVEIVRRYFDAVDQALQAYWKDPRGAEDAVKGGELGPEGVEMTRHLHPNCEWKTLMAGITYRGFVGMASGFDQLVDAAQAYAIKLIEVDDLGGDNVLAVVEGAMKGKASDAEVKATVFAVVTVDEGLITRIDEHGDRPSALEAAGLAE